MTYDAFISYSRRDQAFATLLQKALERYRPPKDLAVPQRYLKIFRDEQDFTGSEYHHSLDKHLGESARMIVICSPAARASSFVNDEILRFAKMREAKDLIPVLLSGIPNNEGKPGLEAENAFPEALCEVLATPLASDYRGFDLVKNKIKKGPFAGAWYKTLADLYGKSRSEIEERERKRKIHRRWLAATVGSLVLVLIVGPSTWLWKEGREGGLTIEQAILKAASKVTTIHIAPDMQPIPGGPYRQGHTNGGDQEQPVHEVTVKPFAIGRFEVTFDEYERFALATRRFPLPHDEGWGRGRRPVISVSWQDARDYAEWLSQKTGKRFRLPTESEWEYAAGSVARNKKDIWRSTSDAGADRRLPPLTAPVGEGMGREPNAFGLYDMHGNVQAWVEDCWHNNYQGAPTDGSAWLESGGGICVQRVTRGSSLPPHRRQAVAEDSFVYVGFRLAQEID